MLSWRQKVTGIKLKQKKIRVGIYEARFQIFHFKSKKKILDPKKMFLLIHQLQQLSSYRILKGCTI